MPDEASLFQTAGLRWSERAALEGLQAVLAPGGDRRYNLFLHGIHTYGAKESLGYFRENGTIVDFGCGTGRFTKFFAFHGRRVIATEITPEMLQRSKEECVDAQCEFLLTDGVSIPLPASSVDGIWCCAVLRYSLFVPNPAYCDIAREMYRVLRPGGYVANCEMYVDVLPQMFLAGFEAAGFATHRVCVLNRYGGKLERLLRSRLIPERCAPYCGEICANLRAQFDDPYNQVHGLRDYFFLWEKPFMRKELGL